MQTHRERREACRLYKAISEVFDRCYDLNDRQKHDMILQCYKVAQDALAEQQQTQQREQMANVSLGRRIV